MDKLMIPLSGDVHNRYYRSDKNKFFLYIALVTCREIGGHFGVFHPEFIMRTIEQIENNTHKDMDWFFLWAHAETIRNSVKDIEIDIEWFGADIVQVDDHG